MAGVGETILREAHRRGVILLVSSDGMLWYFPKARTDARFRRLLAANRRAIAHWLVTDAVTIE